MKIYCPICASRPLDEFSYHGDASRLRPGVDADRECWIEYVYFRENPKGWHQEYWRHQAGCGAWLKVERHTVTHEIRKVELLRSGGP